MSDKPHYDLTEGVYYKPPPPEEDAKGLMLWASYAAVVVLAGLIGAGVSLYGYYRLCRPTDSTWRSMRSEEKEHFYEGQFRGLPWLVAAGAVAGAALGIAYLVKQKYRDQQDAERRREMETIKNNDHRNPRRNPAEDPGRDDPA
jgi:hypothetical protein